MWRAVLAALTASVAAMTLAGTEAHSAPAAETASPWKVFPAATVDEGLPLLGFAWAANRIWIIAPHGSVATLASARVSGRSLGNFAATKIPGGSGQYVPVVDGQLILGRDDAIVAASLLSSGQLGASKPVAGELLAQAKEAAPKVATVDIQAGVHVGDRQVWALRASPACHSIGSCPNFLLACCSARSTAVDLTRFVDPHVGASTPQVRLDARGRLWLAWLDRRDYSGAQRGVPRVLELDPSTLEPRTRAVAAPGLVADKIELTCGTACRVVAQSATGDIVTWAPGERSPTLVVRKLVSRNRVYTFPRELLAATYRAGRLLVGYRGQTGKSEPEEEIAVASGDPRGARSRVVGQVATTYGWPAGKLSPPYSNPAAYGLFVPGGLVALEHFREYFGPPGGRASPVVYAFLPVGR
jgi:hypothetical protein